MTFSGLGCVAVLRRESHYGGRTRAATPSSTAGRSGRAGYREERSTSLTPIGFSRGQAICVGLTSIGIRDAARQRSHVTPRAYRVADACEHAEHKAKLEIGVAIHPARVPSTRSRCDELPQAI